MCPEFMFQMLIYNEIACADGPDACLLPSCGSIAAILQRAASTHTHTKSGCAFWAQLRNFNHHLCQYADDWSGGWQICQHDSTQGAGQILNSVTLCTFLQEIWAACFTSDMCMDAVGAEQCPHLSADKIHGCVSNCGRFWP